MNIRSHLNTLEHAGLVRVAQLEPELEYLFRHALVQEAAYVSLLSSDRRRLHLEVGRAIERLYSERLEEMAPMLARHFELAGENARALEYFAKAAQAALASYANEEAESHFRSALSLSNELGTQTTLLGGLGEVLSRQSRYLEAIEVWKEAIQGYKIQGNSDELARLYARSSRAAWYANDTPLGLAICLEGMQMIEDSPESTGVAILIHETARAYHFNGVPEQAYRYCIQALEMAERLNAIDCQADALTTLGVLDRPPEENLEALRKAIELSESAGLLRIAARAHHNLATISLDLMGDAQTAAEHFKRSMEISRRRGVLTEELFTRISYIWLLMAQGRLDEAEQEITEVALQAQGLPNAAKRQIELHPLKAGLYWQRGEIDKAEYLIRQNREDARREGNLQTLAYTLRELVAIALERNFLSGEAADWAQVEKDMQEVREISARGFGGGVSLHCIESIISTRKGHLQEAHQLLELARQEAVEPPPFWDEVNILAAEAELAYAERRWQTAFSSLERTIELYNRVGRRLDWAKQIGKLAIYHLGRGEPADVERARVLLRQAQIVFEETGANYYAEYAEKQLQSIQATSYAQAIDHQQFVQEMATASRVQEGLLPRRIPQMPGWNVAVKLDPARQISGDFYDFIMLPDGRLGFVVADVADKGAGAALFMAMSHSLIRTFASSFPNEPARVLQETNRRILADTSAALFVTAFYAVLDLHSGELVYTNAGHNPPYLFSARQGENLQSLSRTGTVLGIFEDENWEQRTVTLQPGDALVVYTDGVTEAQNDNGGEYGEQRLYDTVSSLRGSPAEALLDGIYKDVCDFTDNAPQSDDITLLVLQRREQAQN